MSSYSDFIKSQKVKDMQFFFNGGYKKVSNKYFTFNRVVSDDEIIIVTNNIKCIKGNLVLVVDNDKVVYLKDWQVRCVKNWDFGLNAYVVKLKRQYFKPYTFNFSFEDMACEKEQTFDDLLAIAKEQNEQNMEWAFGSL